MEKDNISAEDWNQQGDAHLQSGDISGAIGAYARAVARAPERAGYLHDLGRALLQDKQYAKATDILLRAQSAAPDAWDILCDLGTAQLQSGQSAAALESFTASIDLKPDAVMAHFNLGNALHGVGQNDGAEAAFRRVVELAPGFVPALISLGALLSDAGQPEEALHLFGRAKVLDPKNVALLQNYALMQLRYGNLRKGFAAFESRLFPSPIGFVPRPFIYPHWRGRSLKGRSILIWTEQGLGDEILTAGMFQDVIGPAGSCTIECSARIEPLLRRSFPRANVVRREDPPVAATGPWFDFQAGAFSLGQFLRRDFSAFPKHHGYLRADAALTAKLRERYLKVAPGTKLVGISWESLARHGLRKRLPLDLWHPILSTPGVTFISLQYGASMPGDQPPQSRLYFDHEIDALNDFDASAAQVGAMDLVITVSNTTAHLAGAQNIPVWTMIPNGPGAFWYWFRDRDDSPWYPSMRLFRQGQAGDWQPVIESVASALMEQIELPT